MNPRPHSPPCSCNQEVPFELKLISPKITPMVSISHSKKELKSMQPKTSSCSSRITHPQPCFYLTLSLGNFIKHLSGTVPKLLLLNKFNNFHNPSRTQTKPHKKHQTLKRTSKIKSVLMVKASKYWTKMDVWVSHKSLSQKQMQNPKSEKKETRYCSTYQEDQSISFKVLWFSQPLDSLVCCKLLLVKPNNNCPAYIFF